jgi:phosphatidylserine/phosphatidylglycerophosphate/cardiolipin synthase-like enzyme
LLCDEHAIVGSCNWTNSSRQNQETSVLLFLNETGLTAYDDKLRYLQRQGQPFTETEEARGRQNRDNRRVKSVPPAEDRYRTAKKYSIARARSASRGAGAAQ